ncbi:ATP-dependent Clp protease ATP-binding subunit ClpA [Oligella urethralis]|uniref:ATP-dependent Clp protease ATP-binding subunit ClpA n=1 Tax=Oligella urethralis TaxID=90245 RepID=UPI00288BB169|nr:ATP-dependent Clp protease ATP-binding subunit ClpA [Oligella urethralis]
MISQELEVTIHLAFVSARTQRHEFVTVEHLLLALLDNNEALEALHACHANIPLLQKQLRSFIEDNTPTLPEGDSTDAQPTLGFQRVIQRAVMHVNAVQGSAADKARRQVTGAHILVSLFSEKDAHAVYFLQEQEINRIDIIEFLSHGQSKDKASKDPASQANAQEGAGAAEEEQSTPLQQWAVDLNELAEQGKLDPVLGREHELDRVVQVLCRRRKNNPLLVGEAGVGKTAIAEGLAQRIVAAKVPEILKSAKIYSLDMGSLLAGTKYRGDFEQRIKSLLKQLETIDNSILFIDEIHTMIGAGSTSGSTMDASNLLKPALSSGKLRCMGATTYKEYRGIFAKDHALSRRFQKVDVVEPTPEETIDILKGLKTRFEDYHEIRYSQAAIEAAVELSVRYLNDRFLPDKAIDVLDEAGAAQRLLPKSRQKKLLGKAEVEATIASMARIPVAAVSNDERAKLQGLESELKSTIFGQDDAIVALVSAMKMAHSGLGREDKPIGSFLFSGPTGVGKTEVTKQLAQSLGIELIRFDMSEYMEAHAVSRLIGAPPGYVGYDDGGLLTEQINKHPHSVLLLDEIEKAHPAIYNILLQVMDHGTLTDTNGRKADFRNVVIVMTTNAGAQHLSKRSIGFAESSQQGDEMQEINRTFTPEFRNRLDAIISFAPLDRDIILRVVDKFLIELEQQLRLKQVEVVFSDRLREYLAQHGFDPQMGARPMHRLIQDKIRRALADELLFGHLENGGYVSVDIDEEAKVLLDFEQPKVRRRKKAEVVD